MTLINPLTLTHFLFTFGLAMSALELLFLISTKKISPIWSWSILKNEISSAVYPPFLKIPFLYLWLDKNFILVPIFQIVLILISWKIQTPTIWCLLFLFKQIEHVRFRGTFNGGSDMMTLVVLTGLGLQYSKLSHIFSNIGFIYISIHLIWSYIKAGLVKISNSEWRSGKAITIFLKRSILYQYQSEFKKKLISNLRISKFLALIVLFFELSLPLALLNQATFLFYFSLAIVFHFFIYYFFGLNRFLIFWLSAWPSIYVVNSVIKRLHV